MASRHDFLCAKLGHRLLFRAA